MIIDAISDLHGHYPKLEGGDLLIVAGDLTARDTQEQHIRFLQWLSVQDYKKKIWIAGNHDNFLVGTKYIPIKETGLEYLCDSETEFEGLKIWGSPWTLKFKGMNPKCMAFTCDTEEELAKKWEMIPDDVDILVTHSPPYLICDEVIEDPWRHGFEEDLHVGSKSLCQKIKDSKIRYNIFGHIHEAYGEDSLERISDGHQFNFINASHVNEHYKPLNKPVRVIL